MIKVFLIENEEDDTTRVLILANKNDDPQEIDKIRKLAETLAFKN